MVFKERFVFTANYTTGIKCTPHICVCEVCMIQYTSHMCANVCTYLQISQHINISCHTLIDRWVYLQILNFLFVILRTSSTHLHLHISVCFIGNPIVIMPWLNSLAHLVRLLKRKILHHTHYHELQSCVFPAKDIMRSLNCLLYLKTHIVPHVLPKLTLSLPVSLPLLIGEPREP